MFEGFYLETGATKRERFTFLTFKSSDKKQVNELERVLFYSQVDTKAIFLGDFCGEFINGLVPL